ncbi:MAG TPA: glycoside hydrolase family 99-like domain-containing protein [Polyangiaceae bacterium]|jgi:lipopolysaccharide biosynthesis protein|nr:glycoside hydrolase family 99-like domain-containing protein [Polyangiaceae bacterium]
MTRLLGLYLPQFHPIPENDEWWGKGFTEWTNVTRAQPQFRGHYQPHLPGELGFYDLRLPEVRIQQAALAREYGLAGFCYYHYWFNGRLLLERPLREVLESGAPDFPFCICWANENWTRTWTGGNAEILLEQHYSSDDDREHIRWLLPYLKDRRYVTIQGKPVLMIYRTGLLPDPRSTLAIFREEAAAAGLPGLYLIRMESNFPGEDSSPTELGFDAAMEFQPRMVGEPLPTWAKGKTRYLLPTAFRRNKIRDYDEMVRLALARPAPAYKRFSCVSPGWDNTCRRLPRLAANIWINSTPEKYQGWLYETLRRFEPFGPDEDLVLVNAWNEWAEGNHLEPDRKWGRAYLEATRRALVGAARP